MEGILLSLALTAHKVHAIQPFVAQGKDTILCLQHCVETGSACEAGLSRPILKNLGFRGFLN